MPNDQLDLKDHAERKSLELKITNADKGEVEAVFSTFNVIDHDGDVLLPGAFEDGAKVRISAYGHRSWWGELPVGRGTIRAEKDRAVLVGQFFLSTEGGKETFEVVKQMEELQEWSYSLDDVETAMVSDLPEDLQGANRAIRKVKVIEVSPVLAGASIGTETLSVKDQKREEEDEPPQTTPKALAEFLRFQKTCAEITVRVSKV